MERLTYQARSLTGRDSNAFRWQDTQLVADRLAAYEGTGLLPEEVLRLKESRLDPLEMAKVAVALKRIATLEKALRMACEHIDCWGSTTTESLYLDLIRQAQEQEVPSC